MTERRMIDPTYTTLENAPIGEWVTVMTQQGTYLHINGKDCAICLMVEPTNHNRGPFHATIEVSNPERINLEPADGWDYGRHYFNIDHAKSEVEAWLKAWNQLEAV